MIPKYTTSGSMTEDADKPSKSVLAGQYWWRLLLVDRSPGLGDNPLSKTLAEWEWRQHPGERPGMSASGHSLWWTEKGRSQQQLPCQQPSWKGRCLIQGETLSQDKVESSGIRGLTVSSDLHIHRYRHTHLHTRVRTLHRQHRHKRQELF